jgi:transcriptional regulator with XRE-family HTH domain
MNREDFQHELTKRNAKLKTHLDENEAKRNPAIALVTLRKKAGLTQVELSKKTQMSQAQISKIESPTGPMPTTDTIRRYSDACGFVPVIDFYERTSAKPAPRKPSGARSSARRSVGGSDVWFDDKFRVAAAPLV